MNISLTFIERETIVTGPIERDLFPTYSVIFTQQSEAGPGDIDPQQFLGAQLEDVEKRESTEERFFTILGGYWLEKNGNQVRTQKVFGIAQDISLGFEILEGGDSILADRWQLDYPDNDGSDPIDEREKGGSGWTFIVKEVFDTREDYPLSEQEIQLQGLNPYTIDFQVIEEETGQPVLVEEVKAVFSTASPSSTKVLTQSVVPDQGANGVFFFNEPILDTEDPLQVSFLAKVVGKEIELQPRIPELAARNYELTFELDSAMDGGMDDPFFQLTYEANSSEEVFQSAIEEFEGLSGLNGRNYRIKFNHAPEKIAIDYGLPVVFASILDLSTGNMTFLDALKKECATFTLEASEKDAVELRQTNLQRIVRLESQEFTQTKYDVLFEDLTAEVWTMPSFPGSESLTNQIWESLLPGVPDELKNLGLIGEIVVRNPLNPVEIELEVSLKAFREVKRAEIKAFDLLRKIPCDECPKPEEPVDFARAKKVDTRKSLGREISNSANMSKAKQMVNIHRLRKSGQDFAFGIDQSFLDDIRDLINSLARGFRTVETPIRDNPISFNWFERLTTRFNFRNGEENINEDVINSLKLLFLYYKVYNGDSLTIQSEEFPNGLSIQEASNYNNILVTAQNATRSGAIPPLILFGTEINPSEGTFRLLLFMGLLPMSATLGVTSFSNNRREEISKVEFDNYSNVEFNLGISEIERTTQALQLTIRQMNLTTVLNTPLIRELNFEDNRIRLIMGFDVIRFRAQIRTGFRRTRRARLIRGFTLGLADLFVNNLVFARITFDDVRFAFDLIPERVEGNIRFNINFNETISDIGNIRPVLFNVNLLNGSNTLLSIASILVSIFDNIFIDDLLVSLIEDQLNKFINENEIFSWPDIWHTVTGPEGIGTAALFNSGSGFLEGDLVRRSDLPLGRSVDVDPSIVENLAFIFSARYLTAWVRNLTPILDDRVQFSQEELERRLQLTLPDPRSLPGADIEPAPIQSPEFLNAVGCENIPPNRAPGFTTRVDLVRTLPEVSLPPEGSSEVAGMVVITYNFLIEAYRKDSLPFAVVYQEPCVSLDTLPPSDPDFFPFTFFDLSPLGLRNQLAARSRAEEALQRFQNATQFPPNFEIEGTPGNFEQFPFPSGGGGNPRPLPSPFPNVPDLPSRICPPPFCEFEYRDIDNKLETYLAASVTVTSDIFIGFSKSLIPLLPELELGLAKNPNGHPNLSAVINSFEMSSQLNSDIRPELEAFVLEKALTDATAILDSIATDNLPSRVFRLADSQDISIAGGILSLLHGIDRSASASLASLVSFSQASAEDGFNYTIRDGLLYWPVQFNQDISGNLR